MVQFGDERPIYLAEKDKDTEHRVLRTGIHGFTKVLEG